MGDFEVTLTFSVKAQDRFDAAKHVYRLIDAQTPTSYWVCNEGGVGDEVRVEGGLRSGNAEVAEESVHELVDDLYRLGVSYGAGKVGEDKQEHTARVDDIKRRLVTAASRAEPARH